MNVLQFKKKIWRTKVITFHTTVERLPCYEQRRPRFRLMQAVASIDIFSVCYIPATIDVFPILNIVDCVPRVHHVWRKRNTIHMDKRNIMSAAL